MKNLILIFGIVMLSAFAKEGGGAHDGRGVGGGRGGDVPDMVRKVVEDIQSPNTLIPSSDFELRNNDEFALDINKIQKFLDNGNLVVESSTSIFLATGSSYAIVDGKLYLNGEVWTDKFNAGGVEEQVLRLLMEATEQPNEGNAVSTYYASKIVKDSSQSGLKTLESLRRAEHNGTSN